MTKTINLTQAEADFKRAMSGYFDRVVIFDKIASTNDSVKEFEEGTALALAYTQDCGRGRRGRAFDSGAGGLYMSLKYSPDIECGGLNLLSLAAGVAVAEALGETGVRCGIKYPNDVLAYVHMNKGVTGLKKICGILTECSVSGQKLDYAVSGIGVNVNNKLDPPLKDTAITAFEILQREVDIFALAELIVKKFFEILKNKEKIIDRFVKSDILKGKEIEFSTDNGSFRAFYKGATADGRLRAEIDGVEKIFDSGEVRLIRQK